MVRALILGRGRSGVAAEQLLQRKDFEVEIVDEKDQNFKIVEDLEKFDFIVVSPAVSMNSLLVERAKAKNIPVISELELGWSYLPNSKQVSAITGTNGKTTCSLLLNAIFEEHLKDTLHRSFVCGNIGVAVCSYALDIHAEDFVVIETSSFQLESCRCFAPHIAILTNITPDHLERHGDMDEYIRCKMKIFENQKKDDFAILNLDDEISKRIIMKNEAKKIDAELFFVSKSQKIRGAYAANGAIFFENESTEEIMKTSETLLLGSHNLENILVCVCAARLAGVEAAIIRKAIMNFKAPPHRMEKVVVKNGVVFVNDSKSTNIDSTIKAVESIACNIILLLGGFDKGLDWREVFKKLGSNVKHVIVFGAIRDKLKEMASDCEFSCVATAEKLEDATRLAAGLAEEGDAVLLSPATSSFDEFKDFEERGDVFRELCRNL